LGGSVDLKGHSLLGVFAHPDDESLACGGLFAWCADRGARVSLVCATRGENGPGGGQALGDTRARELREAARALGATDVVLLDHEDGMLPWVEHETLEADICDAIRRHSPDVVITFGHDGLYWHPDHVAVHERTTAAIATMGPDAPVLYYVTMPPGRMREVVETVSARASAGQVPPVVLGISEVDAFGADAVAPTLIVDAGAFAARKLAAIRCHRTQLGNDALHLLSDAEAVSLLGTEHFHRASVGSTREAFIECFSRDGRDARSSA
jgi:LmbE family N-acetylglucosaminyl deacetylase